MSEVRVMAEGVLRIVPASGSGTAWVTGTGAAGVVLGYVQSFTYTSANTLQTIMDRGIPTHHKETQKNPIQATFTLLSTGIFPTAVSAGGHTVPMYHIEHVQRAPERGAASGFYHQFFGCAVTQRQFTEAAAGNTIAFTTVALGMNGPTASGYLG